MIGPDTPGSGRIAFSYRVYCPRVYSNVCEGFDTYIYIYIYICTCVQSHHDRSSVSIHAYVTAHTPRAHIHSCNVKYLGVFRLT